MSAHSLSLLDTTSSLVDFLKSLSNALFQVPVIITALVLTFLFAFLAWVIAFVFLRPKETCSMVCSIHYLLTVGTIVLGLFSAVGLIDHYFPGDLIIGVGVALLVLALAILILIESFNYVVLSNKHAKRHRDLRTPRDRQVRRLLIFLGLLFLGAVLVVVGLVLKSAGIATDAIPQLIVLLLVLWILAIGGELIILFRSANRTRQINALGDGPNLDREKLARIWTRGFSSYRIGRGEPISKLSSGTPQEREEAWGDFTERVFITEELFLEEEGRLDLQQVEEAETYTLYSAAGAGGQSNVIAMHNGHRNQRQHGGHFFRRWGSVLLMLLVGIVAVAFTAAVGSVPSEQIAGIALAFLAPVIFLVIHRTRRDSEINFATTTADKISTSPYNPALATGAASVAAPPAPSRQAATPLHPARPVPVNPPVAEPQIPPKEEPEAPTLPAVENAAPAGAAHENRDMDDTIVAPGRGNAAPASPDAAEDAGLIAPAAAGAAAGAAAAAAADEVTTPAPRVSRSIRVTDFQKYLRGADYPVTRADLLDLARKNNAPPNMIARLEELDPNHQFQSVKEVMIGYANHGVLGTISYPATREQVLDAARDKKVSNKLISWLQGQKEGTTFASLSDLTHAYATHAGPTEEEVE